ncbi:hypothetical protein F7725_007209 [Dissostichus mawsoni]|uniref:Uncharacterized protein n=1 Tax=Dissostichus mawsoni TaxID=36200 RepID=A0A7J5XXW8_DISMA|nr:hypothetical protein F7725_007209 [Dissostichus mawsoni]
MIAVGLKSAKSRLLTQVSEGTLKMSSRWKNGDTCDHYMHKTAQIKSFTGTAVDQSLGLSLEVGAALESGSFDLFTSFTLVFDFIYYPSFKNLEYWSSFHTPEDWLHKDEEPFASDTDNDDSWYTIPDVLDRRFVKVYQVPKHKRVPVTGEHMNRPANSHPFCVDASSVPEALIQMRVITLKEKVV